MPTHRRISAMVRSLTYHRERAQYDEYRPDFDPMRDGDGNWCSSSNFVSRRVRETMRAMPKRLRSMRVGKSVVPWSIPVEIARIIFQPFRYTIPPSCSL